MVDNKTLRARARAQLGGGIFKDNWLMTMVTVFVCNLLLGVSSFVSLIVAGPLEYGLSRALINNLRNGKTDIADIFKGFSEDFSDTLVLGLLKSIFIALWSILFVIPGIVASYSYAMTGYIQQDSANKDWKFCIDESKRIMKGYKFKLFMLDLSFIGWYILGALCLGVGTLFVMPYHEQARANFYQERVNNL